MSDIEEIKTRLDIVSVISQYVPGLKRAGRSYKARCPFHQEKTGSFIVTPEMQRYKCFGCGEGGDVITFIQKIERVEFIDALKIAAEKAGYQLKNEYHKDDKLEKEKKRIIEANTLATKYWNYILATHNAGKSARAYMSTRGIRKEEMQKFQLGYAPKGDNLKEFLLSKNFSELELVQWGLLTEREGKIVDKFRDRLILPIYNTNGEVVGFSGRIISHSDYAPKYLNSPETLVYHKGDILMGLYQAIAATRKHKFLILEEGNIDLLSSHKVGVENIAATGGTSLTEKQCQLIKRYADIVYFCFDTDSAGTKALVRGLEIAERIGLKHKVIDITGFQDPDDLISSDPNKWKEVIDKPVNTVEYLLALFQKDLDLGSPDGKSNYVELTLPVLKALKDKIQLQHFANEIALIVGTTVDVILEKVANIGVIIANVDRIDTQVNQIPTKLSTSPNQWEIYLLALIMQVSDMQKIEMSKDVFLDINCQEIFTRLSKYGNADTDFAKLMVELSDGALETLQQVLAADLTNVNDIFKEMERVYHMLYGNRLRSQILDLRHRLHLKPDDVDVISKLNFLTRELSEISRKSDDT